MKHQQLVDLLKKSGDRVVIGLQSLNREVCTREGEQTVRVVLDKSHTGSLGLSLAKKTGFDGTLPICTLIAISIFFYQHSFEFPFAFFDRKDSSF